MFYNLQPKNVSNTICRQLLEFATPAYLAYYDESQRSDSNAELTRLLLNVSVILNSTTEMAQYHVSPPIVSSFKDYESSKSFVSNPTLKFIPLFGQDLFHNYLGPINRFYFISFVACSKIPRLKPTALCEVLVQGCFARTSE